MALMLHQINIGRERYIIKFNNIIFTGIIIKNDDVVFEVCTLKRSRQSLKSLLYHISGLPYEIDWDIKASTWDDRKVFVDKYKTTFDESIGSLFDNIGNVLYKTIRMSMNQEDIDDLVQGNKCINVSLTKTCDILLSYELNLINDNLDCAIDDLRAVKSPEVMTAFLFSTFHEVFEKFISDITQSKPVNKDFQEPVKNKCEVDDYVDTSKLEVGQVIKNYKVLCDILGEPQFHSGNNQQKCQLRRFERYFRWEKTGQKYVILDIYDEPLSKEDGRKKGNNSIYIRYIEAILMRYIFFKKGKVCHVTKRQIWTLLGMINNQYEKIPLNELQEDVEYSDITKFELNKFYLRCNSRLTTILFSALNNLQNRSLIMYDTEIVIAQENSNGKMCFHVANDSEKRKILLVERKILKQMGFESKNHVACCMRWSEFLDNVNDELNQLYKWKYKFERFKIIYNSEDIQEAIKENELAIQRLMLNDLVVAAIDKNAEVIYENRKKMANEEYQKCIHDWIGSIPSKYDLNIFEYPEFFVYLQKKLSKKFLSLRTNEVTTEESSKELDDLFENLGTL